MPHNICSKYGKTWLEVQRTETYCGALHLQKHIFLLKGYKYFAALRPTNQLPPFSIILLDV